MGQDRSPRAAKIFSDWQKEVSKTETKVHILKGGFQTFFSTYKADHEKYFEDLDKVIWKVPE